VNLVVFALLIEHAIEREPHFSGPHRLRPSLLGPLRIGALQQGHLGRLLASATMSRLRTVAIELGMSFGSDRRRLWVGNPREWQTGRAARRRLVLRGEGRRVRRSESNLAKSTSRSKAISSGNVASQYLVGSVSSSGHSISSHSSARG
jgi:hypothetical protein